MKEFNLESTKYITLDNKVWILPSSVAKLKGKGNGNYNNWLLTGCTNFLLGDELRLIKDSPLWIEAIKLFKAKYNMLITTSEDVKLIDLERAEAYFSFDKPQQVVHKSLYRNNSSLNLPVQEEPTITTLEYATHLGMDHRSVLRTLSNYKAAIERFGPLRIQFTVGERTKEGKWLTKEAPSYYLLTEPQAYFLATLSRNTPQVIEFKIWLVDTFTKLRKEKIFEGPMYELLSFLPGNWEGLIQSILCHLSSYTEHPYRQEVTLNNNNRVDVLMSNKEALEIKNHFINTCHIKELVFNKAYWSQLKEQLPEFETLYITSTKGISKDALTFTKVLEPEIKYISLRALFQKLIPNKDIPLHLFPSI
jgi:phage regulator Rha-like protein